MNVTEILNSYPGETFIREHARAIVQHAPEVNLSWAFVQTEKVGNVPRPVQGLNHVISLANRDRLSRFKKIIHKIKYFNKSDSYDVSFVSQLKQLRPDIIHFQFASTAVRCFHLIARLQIPYTISVRGADIQTEPISKGAGYINKLKEIVSNSSGVHVVTQNLYEELVKYCGVNDKTTVIRTCVSETWANISRKPTPGHFIAVGRLHWRKGYPDLILACSVLKQKKIHFKLTIVGSGSEEQLLKFMIKDLDLDDQITIQTAKGHSYIQNLLSSADAYVLSSLYEGFPNVLAEAMMAKVPIVSTGLPGIKEIVPNDCMFLTEDNNFKSLAEQMEKFINTSAEDRIKKAESAFQIANNEFGQRNHARKFVEFWHGKSIN